MCGIVGIYNSHKPVATELYDSLIHLQHRGQDASGIMTCENSFHKICGKGLVRDVFTQQDVMQLEGRVGIAHVRYPTAGAGSYEEIQPFWVNSPYGIAIAHNGNLVNQDQLADELRQKQYRHLNTSSDSEVMLNLFADGFDLTKKATGSIPFFEQICASVATLQKKITGAYSVVGMFINKGLVAFRDPYGIRPLVFGKRKNSARKYDYIFASEPTMFHSLGFTQVANVQPGEVIYIDEKGHLHQRILMQKEFSPCVFEFIYFARPDAKLDDVSVYRARLRMGQNLAAKWQQIYPNILPDIVIPAPATSNTAALSFAHEIGVRYSEGLYKNPFIGRTFIMSEQEERKRSVRYKLCPQEIEIRNKKVLILDDSIVRGTTSREIVAMVRECGPKEIYFVTTCPPVKFPCFYGIDIPTRKELIAANKSVEKIRQFLGVDKLLYQTEEDLVEAITRKGVHNIKKPCMACLTGKYPSGNITEATIRQLEKKRTQERQRIQTND